MNKYVELPKEHIIFYGDTEEEKKMNETIFDLSLEVDRLWQENKKLKEERKTLYRYTPEKGFRLVGDEDEYEKNNK